MEQRNTTPNMGVKNNRKTDVRTFYYNETKDAVAETTCIKNHTKLKSHIARMWKALSKDEKDAWRQRSSGGMSPSPTGRLPTTNKKKKKTKRVTKMAEDIKFVNGKRAREKWGTRIISTDIPLTIESFNKSCGDVFKPEATIVLDSSAGRQTVITPEPLDEESWKRPCEKIYIITVDDRIVKIGGTCTSMKSRWGSYLCGHHVLERQKKQTCSLTNARLYHTIEKSLLETDSIWMLYTWTLPSVTKTIHILGDDTTIECRTYHVYESKCIKKYKDITGYMPLMSDNCDPKYR